MSPFSCFPKRFQRKLLGLTPAQFLFAKALVHRAASKRETGAAEKPAIDLVLELRAAITATGEEGPAAEAKAEGSGTAETSHIDDYSL